jgi:DeoR family fructose operon transcriptional repressor
MSSTSPNLATEARLAWLHAQLESRGSITLADAAVELGVSEMTVRRDIAVLEERGLARRARGGALPLGPQSFAERTTVRPRAKAQIAAKLASMIPATGIVAFDASSTIMRTASSVTGARDLTIVTNGPDTFTTLQGRPGVTPVLTGGELDPRTGSLVGPIACWSARQLTCRQFFCSSTAIHAESGATEIALEEAEVKRSIALGADEIVLAVDSSKLDRRANAVCLDWSTIDVLVTELDPDDGRLDPYRKLAKLR